MHMEQKLEILSMMDQDGSTWG